MASDAGPRKTGGDSSAAGRKFRLRGRAPFPGREWVAWLVFVALGLGVFAVQRSFDHIRRRREKLKAADELMYFPSGKLLSAVAGEYRMLVADYAWLQVAQYSGAHMGLADQEENYRWVGNATEIIGELDPRFVAPYVFGAQLLAWDAEQPAEGIALLRKGFEANPLAWELPFQAGFIAYMRTKDYDLAGYYFSVAAQLPGAWSVAPRMAAASYAKTGDFELTRETWTKIYEDQPNPKVKEMARKQLLHLIEQELAALQTAVDSFAGQVDRLPASLDEVQERRYVAQVPPEPFGGRYFLRAGKVRDEYIEYVQLVVRRLQPLADRYRAERRALPTSVEDLVRAGYLKQVPPDPLGGAFLIEDGKVRTTSKPPEPGRDAY
jgi:tetratricopeptide (TPR) repeat protein